MSAHELSNTLFMRWVAHRPEERDRDRCTAQLTQAFDCRDDCVLRQGTQHMTVAVDAFINFHAQVWTDQRRARWYGEIENIAAPTLASDEMILYIHANTSSSPTTITFQSVESCGDDLEIKYTATGGALGALDRGWASVVVPLHTGNITFQQLI